MAPLAAQHLHRLPATPQTVAWGYYSAAATPVLHIASEDGDVIRTREPIGDQGGMLQLDGIRRSASVI